MVNLRHGKFDSECAFHGCLCFFLSFFLFLRLCSSSTRYYKATPVTTTTGLHKECNKVQLKMAKLISFQDSKTKNKNGIEEALQKRFLGIFLLLQ